MFGSQTSPALANQTATFTWDGLDAYGRPLQGGQEAVVRIGYVYDGAYDRVSRFGYNGNGLLISGSRTRREVVLWQVAKVVIGPWDAAGSISACGRSACTMSTTSTGACCLWGPGSGGGWTISSRRSRASGEWA